MHCLNSFAVAWRLSEPAILRQISITGPVCVFVAVTLPPAGQTSEQQSEHFKQEVVAHSQELRVESQGNDTSWQSFLTQIF